METKGKGPHSQAPAEPCQTFNAPDGGKAQSLHPQGQGPAPGEAERIFSSWALPMGQGRGVPGLGAGGGRAAPRGPLNRAGPACWAAGP